MYNLYARTYQMILKLASYVIGFREPHLIIMENSELEVLNILTKSNIRKVFIVTDQNMVKLGLLEPLFKHLDNHDINFDIFDQTTPNPTISQVEEGFIRYQSFDAQAMIACGGGSPIDLAKAVLVRHVKPNKPLSKLKGIIKVRKKIPLLIAIPSTVGTGSEATVAAVVSNPEKKEKYAIMDPVLIPHHAILDLNYVKTLPKSLIATTGMDALTHAIEAYLGVSNTKKSKAYALSAIQLIFKNIENAYTHDHVALAQMQLAAYKAGLAFTRAYVGYVHAISHAMTAHYHVAHGLANAVILPHVLTYYGQKIDVKLAMIYDYIYPDKSHQTTKEKKEHIITEIKRLNQVMGIPKTFNNILLDQDIESIIRHAIKESNPLYPVPHIWRKKDFMEVLYIVNGINKKNNMS